MFWQYAFSQKSGNALKLATYKVRVVLSTMYLEQKKSEFTFRNSSTVKEKTLVFEKSEQQNYSSIEMVINEYD